MLCSKCQKETNDSMDYCLFCGAPLKQICPKCHVNVQNGYQFCPACGSPVSAQEAAVTEIPKPSLTEIANPPNVNHQIQPTSSLTRTTPSKTATKSVVFETNAWKRIGLFLLVNAAVIATLSLVFREAFWVFPLIGSGGAFFTLFLSKWLAKRYHKIKIVLPGHFANASEQEIHQMVEDLSKRAGLPTPEVGIYQSNDINAFATGMTKKSSLVAFSGALLEKADKDAVTSIAAHEIAHIANGDMVTLTIVQAIVNTVVLVITLPLWLIKVFAFFSDDVGAIAYWLITAVKFLITATLTFLGSLIVLAFSRRREFRADEGSAQLVSPDSMIHALNMLREDTAIAPKEQERFAAFKISTPSKWLDILSTHPSLERRIRALETFKAR